MSTTAENRELSTRDATEIEIQRRLELEDECRKDPEFLQLEHEMCRRDPVHFITNWCDTFDPRANPSSLPFALWDFQVDLIRWIDERFTTKTNGLLEKSRDMGATWGCAAWAVHGWIFRRGFVCRFGSQKEAKVDDGTIDSIFGKIRFILDRLPFFLKVPRGKDADSYLYILNRNQNNLLIGESTNLSFGRSGRSSIVFLDEFAHILHSEAVWASIKQNSDCVIPLSSPNGKGNQFSWLRHETEIPVKSLHWKQHPKKDQAWYEKEAAEMQPWQIAQELDISYEKSKFGRIYTRFSRQWHVADKVIECKPEWEQWVSWDFGRAGAMALLWIQVSPTGFVEIWNCFELSGQDVDFFLPITEGAKPVHYMVLDVPEQKKIDKAIAKIPGEYRWLPPKHVGDHAGTAKTANSTRSCKDAIRERGYEFTSSGRQGYDWRFECLDELFKLDYKPKDQSFHTKFMVSPDCKRAIDCLNNATWDSDNLHDDTIKPKTNEFFHMVSALEFFAINRFPIHKPSGATQRKWR